MRGSKAKQARRIVGSMMETDDTAMSYKPTGYVTAPWGQTMSTGARQYYQHLKRVLRNTRGVERHTTARQAREHNG
jgi:hypothetical protein